MTWSKPIDEIELAYIEKSWPAQSCADIASKLGRSKRAVEKAVNRLGLREPRAPAAEYAPARADTGDAPAPGREDEGGQDELAELRELKRTLKRSMRDAGPTAMPRLSAEFREVVSRISELEGGGADDGGHGTLGGKQPESLLVSIPLRPA